MTRKVSDRIFFGICMASVLVLAFLFLFPGISGAKTGFLRATILAFTSSTLPATCTDGQVRYDTATSTVKICNSNSWVALADVSTKNITDIDNGDSPYTVLAADEVIFADATAGAITVNLTASAGDGGRIITVFKVDSSANAVTIDGNASETINGNLTIILSNINAVLNTISDAANWLRIQGSDELVESTADLAAYTITADQYGDLTSISLTHGTWDCDALGLFYSSSTTTTTFVNFGISTTAGNSTTGLVRGDNWLFETLLNVAGESNLLTIPHYTVSPTSTTTYYLKASAGSSITNLQITYKFACRRIQ